MLTCLLMQKRTDTLVAMTGVKLISSHCVRTCLPPHYWVMVEEDREQIVPTSQLLRPAAVPSKDDIVKLTGKDTVEGITNDVCDKSLYAFYCCWLTMHALISAYQRNGHTYIGSTP